MKESESQHNTIIRGFSKLNRDQRIDLVKKRMGRELTKELDAFLQSNAEFQQAFSEFSENYLSNYILPFGVVPNVLINGQLYLVPMVIEESSVVAAASRAAGFWAKNGGFNCEVLGATKKGQVHFTWTGSFGFLHDHFDELKEKLFQATNSITASMRKRGGGISSIDLLDFSSKLVNYFQLDVSFETADAMGANFINTCLEFMANELSDFCSAYPDQGELTIVMSILSNHTPESVVKCSVECEIEQLKSLSGSYTPDEFASRFKMAIDMANVSISRAVTHNKGIYNGIDGVIVATGNDWRAVEAAGHAYASRNGNYQSLSHIELDGKRFRYSIYVPLAIGTVGGLTKSHPLARFALEMLGNPSSGNLMEITAALGMANNFSAVASLVTSGIQRGHMKMHLSNILNQLGATIQQKENAVLWFADKTVSYAAVEKYLTTNGGDTGASAK
ncbi:MAG: hydroxymethylglutaryl-CoA reductase [Prolixibacteraceae bacterium]